MKTEDLQSELWARVHVSTYKDHYCPRKLAAALLTDLQARGERDHHDYDDESHIEPCSEGGIDLPGMIMTDRPIEKVKIDTFTLSIPSQDFREFARELAFVHKRVFSDGQEYYKIHGWRMCVVFTPEQRDMVLAEMQRMLPEVEARADAADREFSRRMDEVNKGGVRVLSARDKYSKNAPKRVPAPKKENN
jgi:hypothetical protein